MRKCVLIFLILSICLISYAQEYGQPVIDIHLHAYDAVPPGVPAAWAGEEAARALTSPNDADEHMRITIDQMKANDVVLALVSSSSLMALERYTDNAGVDMLTGIQTNARGMPIISPDSLKLLHQEGTVDVFGELGFQYFGVTPADPRLLQYYTIAEENGIPVCLHTGLGPPGGPHSFAPEFRTTLGKPTLFEPVLVRHPDLKAFIAHAGWPYIEETIAMMYIYPELYTDIGVLTWALPTEAFRSALKRLMDAGFGRRIMFGTDQMIWPGAIEMAIESLHDVPFLSEQEKRDILYFNAARFLELSQDVIDRHHQEVQQNINDE